ncbi:hypothetical protein DFH06DRAFT_1191871, partial [Mycena polygramma]
IPLQCGNKENSFLDRAAAVAVGRCALVCRAWVPSSRRVLFYRVHITQGAAHRFATLFRKPERLTFVPFIRELVFTDSLFHHHWMKTVLPKIVQHLSCPIYLLGYENRMPWGSDQRLPDPSPKLRDITHLEIVEALQLNFSEVLNCIASFPALQALKLWVVNWDEIPHMESGAARPPDTLRTLDLNFTDLDAAISTLALFFPESDSNPQAQQEAGYALGYIATLGTSLTSLSLGFDDTWADDPDTDIFLGIAFLRANTQLRTLSLQFDGDGVMSMLRAMYAPPTLECLTVALYAVLNSASLAEALDSFLSHLPEVKRLNLVHLIPSWLSPGGPDFDDSRPPILLPLCTQRGIVIVEAELESAYSGWTEEAPIFDTPPM